MREFVPITVERFLNLPQRRRDYVIAENLYGLKRLVSTEVHKREAQHAHASTIFWTTNTDTLSIQEDEGMDSFLDLSPAAYSNKHFGVSLLTDYMEEFEIPVVMMNDISNKKWVVTLDNIKYSHDSLSLALCVVLLKHVGCITDDLGVQ